MQAGRAGRQADRKQQYCYHFWLPLLATTTGTTTTGYHHWLPLAGRPLLATTATTYHYWLPLVTTTGSTTGWTTGTTTTGYHWLLATTTGSLVDQLWVHQWCISGWISGGSVVEQWWTSGGSVVDQWWTSGGSVVDQWWSNGTVVDRWWNNGNKLVRALAPVGERIYIYIYIYIYMAPRRL